MEIQDLEYSFKGVMDPQSYDQLECLRQKQSRSNQKKDGVDTSISQKTNVDMKLSVNKFAEMIRNFGYPQEAEKVRVFLKGIGEYDLVDKQHYFKLRDIYKYRQMMIDKAPRNKFESDFDFHEFLFKTISRNDQEITSRDLDDAIYQLGLDAEYGSNTDLII